MKIAALKELLRTELQSHFTVNELNSHIAILLQHYLGYNRAQTILREAEEVPSEIRSKFYTVIADLKANKPIDYIINQSVFFGREFYVNSHVLIPRSETEELVQWILEDELTEKKSVLDIGSGSGCIAITLSLEGNFAQVEGVEVSLEANEVASKNAKELGAEVQFNTANILTELPSQKYDIVVSNPPYVKEEELEELAKNVIEYEPKIALAPLGAGDPLLFYKRMITIAPQILKPNGKMYWEIHEDMGKEVVQLFEGTGFSAVELREDMYGRDRMVKATFN